jgi:hypothetical protein
MENLIYGYPGVMTAIMTWICTCMIKKSTTNKDTRKKDGGRKKPLHPKNIDRLDRLDYKTRLLPRSIQIRILSFEWGNITG